jgi:hypothetical protein
MSPTKSHLQPATNKTITRSIKSLRQATDSPSEAVNKLPFTSQEQDDDSEDGECLGKAAQDSEPLDQVEADLESVVLDDDEDGDIGTDSMGRVTGGRAIPSCAPYQIHRQANQEISAILGSEAGGERSKEVQGQG